MGRPDRRQPVGIDADVLADLAAFGADISALPAPAEDAFEVWAENWPALGAWLACETQWRAVAGAAGWVWLGLDYAAVDVVLRRGGFDEDVFGDLQVMERAAIETFREAQA